MSDLTWQQSLLQAIGIRIEALAERSPRAYLVLTTCLAITGFACLLLFPLLALMGLAGIYQAFTHSPGIAWSALLAWLFVTVSGGLVTWRIIRFRPALPAGVVLERDQAPDIHGLVGDTTEQCAGPVVDRIILTGAYQLDIVRTPRTAMPLWSTRSLVIGLPLMQSLSSQQFGCLLARRLGQFSKRTNPLLNWLYELRDIWPCYHVPESVADVGLLPMRWLFSVYAPLYTVVSTPAARLDELQADSYAMELYSDEEVLEAITTDTVHRLFLREKYWPVIRKLSAQGAAAVMKRNTGMTAVLRAGLKNGTIGQWIEKAISMEQQWNDPCPLLVRRLDNIGHAHARMNSQLSESAVEDYLPVLDRDLKAALEGNLPAARPRTRPLNLTTIKRRLQSALEGLRAGGLPLPKNR